MTSLLRDETPVPIAAAASATMTSCPAHAAARATASPTTPAPTTRICIDQTCNNSFSARMAVLEHFQNKGNPDQRPKIQKIKNSILFSKINGCSRCDGFISGRAGPQELSSLQQPNSCRCVVAPGSLDFTFGSDV